MPASRLVPALRTGAAWLVVGAVAGAFAVAFRAADQALFTHAYGRPDIVSAFTALPVVARLLIPAAGGALAAWLAARARGGSGTGQIIAAVSAGSPIPLRATLVDAAATFSAISSGGSLGREGPLLQVGAAAGSALAPRTTTEAATEARRTLIAAGTAAGFAAAYNTPIAAVVFVIEVVAGRATVGLLLPALAATTVATVISRAALGGGPLYGLRTFALQSAGELAAYGGLGLAAGLAGPAFMALLDGGRRLFRAVPAPAAARGALGGLLVGACALRFPEVAGNGYEVIQRMLDARYGASMLALLLAVKALGTTASVASGSPGGVFTPSLFLGGALGGVAGAAVRALGPAPHATGGYVLVGMATMIAATTHAPVMASVLAFELSGDYAVVLPLFVATTVATLVSRRLRSASIYHL
ncbi:MAG: chloride channel protein [Pseudomonadota bacterium]